MPIRALLRLALAATIVSSCHPLAAENGWQTRYQLARRGVVAFARGAPERLLLTSNESGTFQLYSQSLSSGRTVQITNRTAGKAAGAISPDGKWLYYLGDDAGTEVGSWRRVPFEGGDSEPLFPGAAAVSSTGIAFDSGGRFLVVGSANETGFRFERIDRGETHASVLYRSANEAYGPAISADGRYLTLAETERKNDRHYATLVLDAFTGRRVAELRDGEGNSVTAGPWSPLAGDARFLVQSDVSGFLRPAIFDLRRAQRTPLALDLPGEITAEDWSSDAKSVLLKQHRGGRDRLYLFDLAAHVLTPIEIGEGSVGECSIRPDGKVWAMFQSGSITPRLIEGDPVTHSKRTVVASDDAPPGTEFSSIDVLGARGDRVPALLGIPKHANGVAIVWLHGGPHSETTDSFSPTLQAYLGEGFTVLAPNYHGSSGLGLDWANSVVGDPMHLELEDFRAARQYLIVRHLARPDAIFIAGWSYGGYAALSALAEQPSLWAGGVAGAPITDFALQYADARAALRGWTTMLFGGTPSEKLALYRDRSPLTHADRIRAPLLIFAGRNDRRAPPRQIEAFVSKLAALKKEVSVRWFDAGHGSLSADEQIEETKGAIAFFRRASRAER